MPPCDKNWYDRTAVTTSGNDMTQTAVKSGYNLNDQDLAVLVDDMMDYLKQDDQYDKIVAYPNQSNELKKMRQPTIKDWLKASTCPRLQDARIPTRFHEQAAGTIWKMMLGKVRAYGKVKVEDAAQSPAADTSRSRRSFSVTSSRSATAVTEMMGLAAVAEKMPLSDCNVHIRDISTQSVAKRFPMRNCVSLSTRTELEKNNIEIKPFHLSYDALVEHISKEKFRAWYRPGETELWDPLNSQKIEDDDDLMTTVNSHIAAKKLTGILIEPRTEQVTLTRPRGNTVREVGKPNC